MCGWERTKCGTQGIRHPNQLVQGTDHNFYGTTFEGGTYNSGVIFSITPDGVLTPLYSFCSQTGCQDGSQPQAGLFQNTNGDFYGTRCLRV